MPPAYAQHKLALQTLQSRQPTDRWILKTPDRLWHLHALLATYPDARIIWTRRDPNEKADDGWCEHVHYDALMADPVGTVSRLYGQFDDEVSDLHARRWRDSG